MPQLLFESLQTSDDGLIISMSPGVTFWRNVALFYGTAECGVLFACLISPESRSLNEVS
jgi:hypothetical protein